MIQGICKLLKNFFPKFFLTFFCIKSRVDDFFFLFDLTVFDFVKFPNFATYFEKSLTFPDFQTGKEN